MRNDSGFTMIELIIAVALMVMVMMAVVNISSMGVRYQLQGSRKGQVSGSALSALQEMTRQVEAASFLASPNQGTTADSFVVCQNWSGDMGGGGGVGVTGAQIDATGRAGVLPVTAYGYCIDNTAAGTLWEGQSASCNPAPAFGPSCGLGTFASVKVLVTGVSVFPFSSTSGVWRIPAPSPANSYYFRATQPDAYGDNGVEVHIVFGNPAQTGDTAGHPAIPVPQKYSVETKMNMQKSLNNSYNNKGG